MGLYSNGSAVNIMRCFRDFIIGVLVGLAVYEMVDGSLNRQARTQFDVEKMKLQSEVDGFKSSQSAKNERLERLIALLETKVN